MGIEKLTQSIKRYAPGAVAEQVPISSFKDRILVIESTNWFYKYWKKAYADILDRKDIIEDDLIKNEEIISGWFGPMISFIRTLEKEDIKLVFVFDGKPPEAKAITKVNREEDRNEAEKKLNIIKEKLKKLDILDDTRELVKEYKKYASQLARPSRDFSTLKDFLRASGYPVLHSTGEGEKLASALVKNGLADAVISTDTDNLPFGCPLWISKYDYKMRSFTCVSLKEVLKGFDFEMETFVDFCIMSGCDYNGHQNIPKCGPVTSYNLLKKAGKIENLPKTYLEKIECLKYQICRNEFKIDNINDLCSHEIKLEYGEKDHEFLRSFAEKYDLVNIVRPEYTQISQDIEELTLDEFI